MTRLDPEEARQGKKGTPVLGILIAALVLCAIGAVGMAGYAWMMPDQSLPKATTEEGGVQTPPAAQPSASGTSAPEASGTTTAPTQPSTSN